MLLEERLTRQVSPREAAELAAELYGIEARARELPGEYDDNFQLTAANGESFVLKVMHPARERSFIEMQCSVLRHLAERAPELGLPRVMPTRRGEAFANVSLPHGAIKRSKDDDEQRLVWMLTYIPGTVLAEARPHSTELLESVGEFLGQMDAALVGFDDPSAHRELKWDLARAEWIRQHLHCIADGGRRALVEKFLARYDAEVVPALGALRQSVVYGDANDYNVLVGPALPLPRRAISIIDFGDLHHTVTVSEVAIAAAYAILGEEEPLTAAAAVLRGYHQAFPLNEPEVAALYALMGIRLAVSVTNSAQRKGVKPDDAYVTISEAPAWEALERLSKVHPRFAHYVFREASGFEPAPSGARLRRWLAANGGAAASVLKQDLRTARSIVFDFSAGSTFLGADLAAAKASAMTEKIFAEMWRAGAEVGVGRYDEARAIYSSALFGGGDVTSERRTIHLGMDLQVTSGSAVHAPMEGFVHAFADNAAELDYGPVVILRHAARDEDGEFDLFTLYGHLSRETLASLRVGQCVGRGERFARVGTSEENGGWAPHLHFQIIADLLERGTDFPGVARAAEREVWTSLSPDPNLLLGIPADRFPQAERGGEALLKARREALGRNLSVSYARALKIVRGWMQYLYDDTARAYLDFYNNVPLVGHSHPRVVRAAQEQLGLLNTNTRYLHENAVQYAERLRELLPEPLRVCYLVNSGSEANELALRLARAKTEREDTIVLEHAYHGNTNTLIDISPYKFDGRGGRGRKEWVHVAPIADDYRGPHRREDRQAGAKYAAHVKEIVDELRLRDRGVGAFMAETLPSVAGQIVFPPGYLAEAYKHVRAAGGVCIADEVQVGFGRLGTNFWGFETQGVIPDVVVLGKPIANGFPLGVVVTTREVAAAFENGMEFFSTFGGNPVACAAGLATLDVLKEERLQERALRVGNYLLRGLRELQKKHEIIGDVRGSGLFLGVDLVQDRETREAAPAEASYIVNRLRELGVLTGTDGPHENVIKLRPPLIISEADAELFLKTLGRILGEDAAQPRYNARGVGRV